MARVITFSLFYPPYHPLGGEPTNFVEKIWAGFDDELDRKAEHYIMNYPLKIEDKNFDPKYHTTRFGRRFKKGDYFSPRVWSGKPYRSPQIIIAPDLEIKNTWDVEIDECDVWAIGKPGTQIKYLDDKQSAAIARNDGLTEQDLYFWFKEAKKPFLGQVICWNKNIKY